MNKYFFKILTFLINFNLIFTKEIGKNFEIKISLIDKKEKENEDQYMQEILDVIRRPSAKNSFDELPSTLVSTNHSQPQK